VQVTSKLSNEELGN